GRRKSRRIGRTRGTLGSPVGRERCVPLPRGSAVEQGNGNPIREPGRRSMSGPKERFMRRCRREPAVALTLLILALPGTALAAPGETGFAFLKLGVGARPMALGRAYVALADDPTAIYWNPAGLAAISGTHVTAVTNEWIQALRHDLLAARRPFGAAVQSRGSDAKFISVTFPIPLTWRAGAAVSRQLPSLQGRGTLTTEIRKARDDKTHFHAGAEYSYRDRLALRVGGKFGYDDE